ncbi:transglutaminase domain-containing protein [Dactylosporangium sp. NPDC050588]|uniref:transglutaminase domain-containing protein n=1 Tax=Dactylosporangium sp. NPDC050588 TaxID=3157211 RepID=UPI0033C2444F
MSATASTGSTAATPILDLASVPVLELMADLETAIDPLTRLRRAHGLIAARVRPVYAVDDQQPVSETLTRGRGSCSQRLAVLEAVARAIGVATRCRALLIDGRFWYPRFTRFRHLVPSEVLLAWPEFYLDGRWVSTTELFGSVEQLSASGDAFTNSGGETLFDAVARTAVDWDGVSSTPGACSACDLSAAVLADLGHFDSRDQLFATHGQTMCWGARTLTAPILNRWTARHNQPN